METFQLLVIVFEGILLFTTSSFLSSFDTACCAEDLQVHSRCLPRDGQVGESVSSREWWVLSVDAWNLFGNFSFLSVFLSSCVKQKHSPASSSTLVITSSLTCSSLFVSHCRAYCSKLEASVYVARDVRCLLNNNLQRTLRLQALRLLRLFGVLPSAF